MKALLTLKSAKDFSSLLGIAALIVLAPAVYPEFVLAAQLQTSGKNQAIVFEINDSSKLFAQNQKGITIESLKSNDPLILKLEDYLEKYNSPLAPFASEIIQQPQWQRALAISWVESNFGIHCYDNNCSGIGVQPGHPSWRKYPTKLEWFKDMSQLLEKPIYKEKYTTFEKMKGVYVQPGSRAWVNGSKQKYAQLMALTAEAENEKIAMSQLPEEGIQTFPELAILTK